MLIALLSAVIAVAQSTPPPGWVLAGSSPADYITHTDPREHHSGGSSGHLRSRSEAAAEGDKFGTLMQSFKADTYRGKRVRLSAYVKLYDVRDWAGLWMRIDGPKNEVLGFDNMQDRPLRGTLTSWTPVFVVLDVPDQAEDIALGILVAGYGGTWIDDVTLEVVDTSVPVTGIAGSTPGSPQNLDFER